MHNKLDPLDDSPGDAGFKQIVVDELDPLLCQVLLEILQAAAAQIVDDAHLRAASYQGIRDVRANE